MRSPMEIMIDRAFKNEESIVRDGEEAARPRLTRRMSLRFILVFSAGMLTSFERTEFWAYMVLLAAAAAWAGMEFIRAGAYRNGWIEGREHMMASAKKYDRLETWVEAMFVHDTHVMGYRLITPDSPEGLEEQ